MSCGDKINLCQAILDVCCFFCVCFQSVKMIFRESLKFTLSPDIKISYEMYRRFFKVPLYHGTLVRYP